MMNDITGTPDLVFGSYEPYRYKSGVPVMSFIRFCVSPL